LSSLRRWTNSGHFFAQPRHKTGIKNHPRQSLGADEHDILCLRLSNIARVPDEEHIELLLPTTGERAFVQIKSSARKKDLAEYLVHLKGSRIYDRMMRLLTWRDFVVLIDVERRNDSLRKHIHDVVIRVCAVMELSAKRCLPLLCL